MANSVPSDNPFVNRPGVCPTIWAYSLREPWRFSFDPLTDDLWVGDVGQDLYEEVDIVRKGEKSAIGATIKGPERAPWTKSKHRRQQRTTTPRLLRRLVLSSDRKNCRLDDGR